jgi:hypothetical protein
MEELLGVLRGSRLLTVMSHEGVRFMAPTMGEDEHIQKHCIALGFLVYPN